MKQVSWRDSAAQRSCVRIGIAISLGLLFSAGVARAGSDPGPTSGQDRRQESVSRAALLRLLDDVELLARTFRDDAAIRAGIADARQRVERATDPELEALREHGTRLTQMALLLERIRVRLEGAPAGGDPESEATAVVEPVLGRVENRFPSTGADPLAGGLAVPALAPSILCSGSRRASGELLVLLEEVLGAEIGQAENSRVCNQVIVLSGNGGNLSLLCILSDVIFLTVRGSYDSMLLCERLLDRSDLERAARGVDQVRGDVSSAQTSVSGAVAAAKLELEASVENARAQLHSDLIAAGNAANERAAGIIVQINAAAAGAQSGLQAQSGLILRLELERALHSGKHYASLYLPEANGGHLGLARQILIETMDAVRASGETINGAQQDFSRGEAELAARHWKRAFTYYARAYLDAVRFRGEESVEFPLEEP